MNAPNRRGGLPGPDVLARLQGALPLLIVYFAFAALYAWQASRRPMPTIFTDELELTQLSRAISDSGEAARRGDPYGLATLVAYVLAPVWWIGSMSTAYATAKVVLVLAMTATLFPAYALARLVVPPWYALAAAAGSVAVPALAYSPILVEEPLAYPLSALALWLIARTLVEPGWLRAGLAAVAAVAAALTRTQLAVLFAVLFLALLWLAWQSEPARRWRSSWGTWDWIGTAALVLGLVLGFSALMGHLSTSWRETTFLYKDRIFDHAVSALGAFTIGIGVLPVLAGLSALARPRGERRDRGTDAFVATSVSAVAAFVWYAGIKGAYIENTFSNLVVERNLIYLAPIVFAASALAAHRGVGRWWAMASAAVVVVYVVAATPLELSTFPYYEAHGLSIGDFANREWHWPEGRIRTVLVLVSVVAIAVVVALRLLRHGTRAFAAVAIGAAALVGVWSLTAEVYAAHGEEHLSREFARSFPRPVDWVDQVTGGRSVVVITQQISNGNGIHLTEFWNRSIRKVWSLDGTAPGPGPILTPDLQAVDGTLTPNPETEFALAVNGVELSAPVVARRGDAVLYRIDRKPLRLAAALTGIDSDGWMLDKDGDGIATASYTRYDVSHDGAGFAVGKLSRVASCPGKDAPGKATVKIGPVAIGPDKQPTITHVTATWPNAAQARKGVNIVHQCNATGFALPTPNRPWRIEIAITPTFVPQELNPAGSSDRRRLGAVVQNVGFQPLFGG